MCVRAFWSAVGKCVTREREREEIPRERESEIREIEHFRLLIQ